jgi:integrase
MAKSWTVKEIESAKPKSSEYKLTIYRGLYIRVATSGVKTWLIRYVVCGKQKQYRLPEPFGQSGKGCMSLVEAKAKNTEIQSLARKGIDFQIQKEKIEAEKKQQADIERLQNLTFNDLYKVWIIDGVNRVDGNEQLIRTFKLHILPSIGNTPLKDINDTHLTNLYKKIIASEKHRTAVVVSKSIVQILTWAEKRKPYRALLIDGNPALLANITPLLPNDYTPERERCLSIDEIKKLQSVFVNTESNYLNAPAKYGTERPLKKEVQLAMWICLGTLCRIGELLMAEWTHVDFEKRMWHIPKENTKGAKGKKQAQNIYLSDFTLMQFKQLQKLTGETKWLFPATNNEKHVCIKSASKQIGDRQAMFKKHAQKMQHRVESNSLVLGEVEWTPHDLRRTGATMMQELKITLDVIDRCQNHVLAGSKVRRHYLHYEYADEKQEAWTKLGDRLSIIIKSAL